MASILSSDVGVSGDGAVSELNAGRERLASCADAKIAPPTTARPSPERTTAIPSVACVFLGSTQVCCSPYSRQGSAIDSIAAEETSRPAPATPAPTAVRCAGEQAVVARNAKMTMLVRTPREEQATYRRKCRVFPDLGSEPAVTPVAGTPRFGEPVPVSRVRRSVWNPGYGLKPSCHEEPDTDALSLIVLVVLVRVGDLVEKIGASAEQEMRGDAE